MTWIERRLDERRVWQPSWLGRLFVGSFAVAIAIPLYAIARPPAPSWYGILAIAAMCWFSTVMGIQAIYERRWKRRSKLH